MSTPPPTTRHSKRDRHTESTATDDEQTDNRSIDDEQTGRESPDDHQVIPSVLDRRASLSTVRETYATQADSMARFTPLNRLFTGRFRKALFGRADGRVLDVACGTGLNLRYLSDSVTYVGIDASPDMLAKARERHGGDSRVSLAEMDAEALAFDDDSFETVISSLSTCTFPNPVPTLREMGRVCRPDGEILLLEHGQSDVGPIARFQDWRADAHFEKHACRWNQDPTANVTAADLDIHDTTSGLFGMLTAIVASPG